MEKQLRKELDELEDRYFVGREEEVSVFSRLLNGEESRMRILNIYGTGGMGKSTLLDRFRRMAKAADALFLYVDSRMFDHSPSGLSSFLVHSLHRERQKETDNREEDVLHKTVSLINDSAQKRKVFIAFDTFEEMGDMEFWLREELFPMLDARVKLIVAGRNALKGPWITSPAWRQVIIRLPIGQLRAEAVKEYLQKQGFTEEVQIDQIALRSIGHPLTLSLAAYYLSASGGNRLDFDNETELTGMLAECWLKEVPESLRELTEAASILRTFNRESLLSLLERPVEATAFDQLIHLSFVRATERGWAFHDLMRDAVIQQLRLHSPARYRQLQAKAIRYYYHKIVSAPRRHDMGWELSELFFYFGDSMIRAFLRMGTPQLLPMEPLTEATIVEAESYLAKRRETAVGFQHVMRDPDSGHELNLSMSFEDDLLAIQGINFRELLDLDRDTVKLFRDDDGEIIGFTAFIPIHEGTLNYLMTQPYSRAYFASRTEEQLQAMRVPKGQAIGWFIRSSDTIKQDLPQVIYTSFHALFSLSLSGGLIVASPPPQRIYQEAHVGMGYEQVENVFHTDYDGRTPTPTHVLDTRGQRMEAYLRKLISGLGLEEEPSSALSDVKLNVLSAREREVAQLLAGGLTNLEIAQRLFVSEITIKKHLTSIYSKMQVRNRAELVKHMLSQ